MGESKRKREVALATEAAMVVDTLGGRMHVRWDESAQATPNGQLVFFAEFLATAGIFERWVEECPLTYTSPNAPTKRDVLGTLLLAIVAGHKRYAHITALRGDAVAAQALGMRRVISEDAMRRALLRIDEDASAKWLRPALMSSVSDVLDRPWILDIDATIKTLFGHQEGATLGYNPHKLGRPSHALHTYWVGNLRLVLDVGEWGKPGATTFKPFLELGPFDPASFSGTTGRMIFVNRHSTPARASAAINERHAGSSASAVSSQTVC
jgi:hypothetical protein